MRCSVRDALGVLLCLLVLSGCNEPPQAFEVCAPAGSGPQLGTRFANGTVDTANRFMAVACLGSNDTPDGAGTPCASGTLITRRHILTAQHLGGPDHVRGRKVSVKFGVEARTNPVYRAVANRCWEFRNTGPAMCCRHVFKPFDGTTDEHRRNYENYLRTCADPLEDKEYVISDLAVWELEAPVVGIEPIAVALENPGGGHDLGRWKNAEVVAVGYGSTDSCYTPQTPSGTRRYGSVRIAGERWGNTWTGDFTWTEIGPGLHADYKPEWGFTAPGDSGGPLLARYDGRQGGRRREGDACVPVSSLRVIGATYRGCNFHNDSTIYEPVSRHLFSVLSSSP